MPNGPLWRTPDRKYVTTDPGDGVLLVEDGKPIPATWAHRIEPPPADEQSVADLKEALAKRGLPVSGSKAELVARLEGDDGDVADSD